MHTLIKHGIISLPLNRSHVDHTPPQPAFVQDFRNENHSTENDYREMEN